MAELLSHIIHAYVALTVASWYVDWLTPRWIAVGTIGAILPDLNRLGLLVDERQVEAVLGVQFTFDVLHTLGGVLLLSAIGSLVVRTHHRRVGLLLFVGGAVHLLVDGLKMYADGTAAPWLYPFTWYAHPTPNLYVSSEPTVLLASGALAITVRWADRRRRSTSESTD